MTKLTEVEFHINPTIKPYEVVQYFQMLKNNGQKGALVLKFEPERQ
jgi:hypothetical protein